MPSVILRSGAIAPGQTVLIETSSMPSGVLPLTGDIIEEALVAKYGTLNATTGSLPAGAVTGANWVYLLSSNATPGAQLVRTAAQMLADTPNGAVGMNWTARIINSGAGTLTLTADAGATVTINGTATVPTNTFRDFMFTLNTATTATVQSVGAGDI